MKLLENVKPDNFNLKRGFMDSLGKHELEVVARNVVVISANNGNSWFPFTFAKYKELCQRECTGEEACLEELARRKLLTKKRNQFSVNENFIRELAKFIK